MLFPAISETTSISEIPQRLKRPLQSRRLNNRLNPQTHIAGSGRRQASDKPTEQDRPNATVHDSSSNQSTRSSPYSPLSCALCASLTMLIQQAVHYSALQQSQITQSEQSKANGTEKDKTASTQTTPSQQPSTEPDSQSEPTSGPAEPADPADGLLNINTAGSDELQTLKGVGPVTAQRIIDYRNQIGRFDNVDQLLEVKGIGEKNAGEIPRPSVRTMRGNTFEWRDGEQGSRDWRLLPAALCGWAASLATHMGFDYCVERDGRFGMLPLVVALAVPLLALLGLLGLPFLRSPMLRVPVGVRRAVSAWHFSIIVCVVAAMACASSALTYDVLQWRDAASYAARNGESDVVTLVRTTSPAVNSNRRANDCQIDATISTITASQVTQPSMMRVRVYADRPDCGTLKQGGEYRMRGTLAISQYGAMPLWLTDIASVERIRGPNLALRTIGMMQQAFFEQTSRLSDQGKVLVPGLTLGILGQDYVPPDSGNGQTGTGIDSTYANLLENAFQRSGITASDGGQRRGILRSSPPGARRLLVPAAAQTRHGHRHRRVVHHAGDVRVPIRFGVARPGSWVWRERASCSSAEERKPCQPSAGPRWACSWSIRTCHAVSDSHCHAPPYLASYCSQDR